MYIYYINLAKSTDRNDMINQLQKYNYKRIEAHNGEIIWNMLRLILIHI